MPFNYSLPTNITGFSDTGVYLNGITDNGFGIMLTIAIFVIFFISFRGWNFGTGLAAAGFISFVASTFLWLMDWVTFVVVPFFLLITAMSFLMGGKNRGGG